MRRRQPFTDGPPGDDGHGFQSLLAKDVIPPDAAQPARHVLHHVPRQGSPSLFVTRHPQEGHTSGMNLVAQVDEPEPFDAMQYP